MSISLVSTEGWKRELVSSLFHLACSAEKGKERRLDDCIKNLVIRVYTTQQLDADGFIDEKRGGKRRTLPLLPGMSAYHLFIGNDRPQVLRESLPV